VSALLEQDRKGLENARDCAKLKAEIDGLSLPWWRRGLNVGALVLLTGAILPIATAVQERYRTERELALKASEQRQAAELAAARFREEIRSQYLDRMKNDAERQRVIRFIVATATEDSLRKWAQEEKKIVDDEVDKLKKDLVEVKEKVDGAVDQLQSSTGRTEKQMSVLHRRLADLSVQKEQLEARLDGLPPVDRTSISRLQPAESLSCVDNCLKNWGFARGQEQDRQYEATVKRCADLCRSNLRRDDVLLRR
jgi:hypothetical protein